jgi:hypothetical protein
MRMNGDQERRAETLVAVLSGVVAPAFPGALCAALEIRNLTNGINREHDKYRNSQDRRDVVGLYFRYTETRTRAIHEDSKRRNAERTKNRRELRFTAI